MVNLTITILTSAIQKKNVYLIFPSTQASMPPHHHSCICLIKYSQYLILNLIIFLRRTDGILTASDNAAISALQSSLEASKNATVMNLLPLFSEYLLHYLAFR